MRRFHFNTFYYHLGVIEAEMRDTFLLGETGGVFLGGLMN